MVWNKQSCNLLWNEIKQNKRMIEDLTKKQIEDEIQQGNYNFNVQQIVHDILQKLNNQEVSLKTHQVVI